MMKRKVTLVGAGLVGSLLAILLRKRGFEVTILEKRADPRGKNALQGRSINLIITSRGLLALSLAGLEQKAKDLSVKVFGREIHDLQSRTVYQAYGKKDECNYAISRGRLNEFLIAEAEHAGAKILFEQNIREIDFNQKELVMVDGNLISYDLLMGTDGVGSVVRQQLIKKKSAEFQEKIEWLGVSYKELMIPTGERGEAQLKPGALHIWPRGKFMMMALENFDHSFTMTLYMKENSTAVSESSFSQLKNPEEIQSFFRKQFPDAVDLIDGNSSALVKDFETHPRAPLGTVRLNRWVHGDSVALFGDAAHGIVPFFGQGMNCGFEDCSQLMALLDTEKNWTELFQKYHDLRKPNADAIADMAVENWYEMSEKVADPKFLLRKKAEAILEEKMPQQFKSRYGMVTYTQIPYAIVQKLGERQNQLFQTLLANTENIETINWPQAEALIQKEYTPYTKTLLAMPRP